jgi:DNA-directed RNA polymerase subunit omega
LGTFRRIVLNIELLNKAKERVPSIPILINMVSKRVRQLTTGFRPYVKPESPNEDMVDIALREIAEGVLIAEMDFAAPEGQEDTV